MKTSISYLLLLCLVGVTTHQTYAEEAIPQDASLSKRSTFTPRFDLSGNWISPDSPAIVSATRHGKSVSFVYNTSGYHHLFEGIYTDEQTITGIQLREKLSDGSRTEMQLQIVLTSSNRATVTWVTLDSNSDLIKGQRGEDSITRVNNATNSVN